MNINDFIGKVVIPAEHKRKLIITRINGVGIYVKEEDENKNGTHSSYFYPTSTGPNDNAIARGTLAFEDNSLTKPFVDAYENYKHSEGKMDMYFYYMSHYD